MPLILRLIDRERHFLLWCGCEERRDEAHRRVVGERCFAVERLESGCGVELRQETRGVGDGVECAEEGWEGRNAHGCVMKWRWCCRGREEALGGVA